MESAREQTGDRDEGPGGPITEDTIPAVGRRDQVSEFRTDLDSTEAESAEPLLPRLEIEDFRTEWRTIQAGFVDEPQRSVKDADRLVSDLMQRLSQSFSEARADLERQWDRGDEVSTDDLRLALQQYRSFFNRLLAA